MLTGRSVVSDTAWASTKYTRFCNRVVELRSSTTRGEHISSTFEVPGSLLGRPLDKTISTHILLLETKGGVTMLMDLRDWDQNPVNILQETAPLTCVRCPVMV